MNEALFSLELADGRNPTVAGTVVVVAWLVKVPVPSPLNVRIPSAESEDENVVPRAWSLVLNPSDAIRQTSLPVKP